MRQTWIMIFPMAAPKKPITLSVLQGKRKKEPKSRTRAVGEIKCKSLRQGWSNNQRCIFLKSFQHGMFFRTTFRLVEIGHLSKSTCREYVERGRKDLWFHSMDGTRLGYLCLAAKMRVELTFQPYLNLQEIRESS